MGFLKKLVGGIKKVTQKVSGVVSVVAGFAGKILPAPLGVVATAASKVTGFTAKLLDGVNKAEKVTNLIPEKVFEKVTVLPNPYTQKLFFKSKR